MGKTCTELNMTLFFVSLLCFNFFLPSTRPPWTVVRRIAPSWKVLPELHKRINTGAVERERSGTSEEKTEREREREIEDEDEQES